VRKLSKDEKSKARVRSAIWDFLHVNKLIDSEDFSIELTDKLLAELLHSTLSNEMLLRVLSKIETPFFKINSISKKKFADLLISDLEKRIAHSIAGIRKQDSVNPPKPITILFLSANPKNTETLRLEEEFREIRSRVLKSKERDKLTLVQRGAVRVGDLQFYLNQETPTIVHFSGHGTDEGTVVLEDNMGNAQIVTSEALARVFEILKDNIRCVVLNACFSRKQALAISRHIDCVIGMSTSISDKAAIVFSSAFYLAIASGKSVENAFEQGIAELMLWNIKEDETPVLFCKRRVDPSTVFLLPANSSEK
jgi:CHAT domain